MYTVPDQYGILFKSICTCGFAPKLKTITETQMIQVCSEGYTSMKYEKSLIIIHHELQELMQNTFPNWNRRRINVYSTYMYLPILCCQYTIHHGQLMTHHGSNSFPRTWRTHHHIGKPILIQACMYCNKEQHRTHRFLTLPVPLGFLIGVLSSVWFCWLFRHPTYVFQNPVEMLTYKLY